MKNQKNPERTSRFRFGLWALLFAAITLLAACGDVTTPSDAESVVGELQIGTAPDGLSTLDTSALSGTVTVSVGTHPSITRVAFYLDDPYRRSAPAHTDTTAPFTFELDTTTLENGPHTLTALITVTGWYGTQDVVRRASFTVDNGSTPDPEPPAETPENRAPSVDAGEDMNVTLPDGANLDATVSDDGLPNGQVSVSWRKLSGPGSVNFGNRYAQDTTASFSEAGRYTLRLSATDGSASSYDDIVVNVVASETVEAPAASDELGRVLELVNDARSTGYDCGSAGRFAPAPALTRDARLDRAAQGHADSMERYGYFSHTGRDGSSVATRVSREGYSWSRVGENIAWGQPTPERVVSAWLASPGHCANIMRPQYEEIGLGLADAGSPLWVQVFATPR